MSVAPKVASSVGQKAVDSVVWMAPRWAVQLAAQRVVETEMSSVAKWAAQKAAWLATMTVGWWAVAKAALMAALTVEQKGNALAGWKALRWAAQWAVPMAVQKVVCSVESTVARTAVLWVVLKAGMLEQMTVGLWAEHLAAVKVGHSVADLVVLSVASTDFRSAAN